MVPPVVSSSTRCPMTPCCHPARSRRSPGDRGAGWRSSAPHTERRRIRTPRRRRGGEAMPLTLLLDVILALLLLGYLLYGIRAGLLRSIFPIAGVVAGGIAGILLLPVLTSIVPDPGWRIAASIALVVGLVAIGNGLGAAVGSLVSGTVARGPIRIVDS